MAASLKTRSRRGRLQRNAEINVTPFVDVMLVLLIVFMVSAPLLRVSLPVDLPSAEAEGVMDVEAPLTITLAADGAIYIDEEPLDRDTLLAYLEQTSDKERTLFLRGDRTTPYEALVPLLAELSQAGFTKLSLVAIPES